MTMEREGSITFWLRHQNVDWYKDENSYNFGPFAGAGISVHIVKHPTRKLTLDISGPFGKTHSFNVQVPECSPKGLFVAITWKDNSLRLYLNGKEIEVKTFVG